MDGEADGDGQPSVNLPTQVAALCQARKEQVDYLTKLQIELTEAKAHFSKAKREHEQLEMEGNTLVSKICIQEELGLRKKKRCQELEEELILLNKDKKETTRKINQTEAALEKAQRTLDDYKEKMAAHKLKVAEAEKDDTVMSQLNELCQEIQTLETKREDLQSNCSRILTEMGVCGMSFEEIEQKIREKEDDLEDQKSRLAGRVEELELLREEKRKAETTNAILTKRNVARLTRLSRRLEQQKDKRTNLVWSIEQSKNKIAAVKETLESFTAFNVH
ncbi:kinesin-like protein KIN-UA [Aplysia californica]|uniref:Kinesin-like protein KIN-UA n=1 Tax=Aplysia californica TaxID=6500 RepID=A0ABM0JBA2_APLCA|nr:kinesin-like protein KIN-UA [Aplysia californica]